MWCHEMMKLMILLQLSLQRHKMMKFIKICRLDTPASHEMFEIHMINEIALLPPPTPIK